MSVPRLSCAGRTWRLTESVGWRQMSNVQALLWGAIGGTLYPVFAFASALRAVLSERRSWAINAHE